MIRNVKFMPAILQLLSLAALFSISSIASAQSGPSDPSGTWRWKYDLNGTIQGRVIKADYSGRPYGNVIQGEIQYDLDGNEGEIDILI
jgi:hypothetical protein